MYKRQVDLITLAGLAEVDNVGQILFRRRCNLAVRRSKRVQLQIFFVLHPSDLLQVVSLSLIHICRTKMDEQNKYSGLVVCADCGKAMVLHRAHTMSADYNHFTCRTYKKDVYKRQLLLLAASR